LDLYSFFKTLAFKCDPELVHEKTLKLFAHAPWLANFFNQASIDNKFAVSSHHFKVSFPIGLAAGLDKNAIALDFFSRLYFGFIEVGTVTPFPQPGNSKPRLFRYPLEENIRNRMGFNNDGMAQLVLNLKKNKLTKPIGINLGKNKNTTEDKAIDDYIVLAKTLQMFADYLVINISSPNTPGLRNLQSPSFVSDFLTEYKKLNLSKPLFIKISPDMSDEHLNETIKTIVDYGAQGILATNTTIISAYGEGGMSGKILLDKATRVRNHCLNLTKGVMNFEVIGIGGISKTRHLLDFWMAGGKLAQIYSSFIFHGPKILSNIKNDLEHLLKINQVNNLNEFIKNIHHLDLSSLK
jgi:dihydroorotate dehydrogenase